jgi:hypothetical protein
MVPSIQILNTANWHACKAIAAYQSGDLDAYARHIAIADALWLRARWV